MVFMYKRKSRHTCYCEEAKAALYIRCGEFSFYCGELNKLNSLEGLCYSFTGGKIGVCSSCQ